MYLLSDNKRDKIILVSFFDDYALWKQLLGGYKSSFYVLVEEQKHVQKKSTE